MCARTVLKRILAGATGRPASEIQENIRRDFHLTAEKALDYGVIDKVLYKRRGVGAR